MEKELRLLESRPIIEHGLKVGQRVSVKVLGVAERTRACVVARLGKNVDILPLDGSRPYSLDLEATLRRAREGENGMVSKNGKVVVMFPHTSADVDEED